MSEQAARWSGESPVLEFVDAVAALPCLRGGAERSVVTRLLSPELAVAVRHDQRVRVFAFNLVRACLDREHGLHELLEILSAVEGESRGLARVLALATRISYGRKGSPDGVVE